METTKIALVIAMIAIIIGALGVGTAFVLTGNLTNEINDLKSELDLNTDLLNLVISTMVDLGNETDLEDLIAYLKLVSEAKKEGKLVYYTSTSLAEAQNLVAAFMEVYPFIDVQIVRAGTSTLVERYLSEVTAGQTTCDVMEGGTIMPYLDLKEQGYVVYYDSREYAYYPSGTKEDGYWCTWRGLHMGIMYNTDIISEEDAPKVWADLFDPKWKEMMGMGDMRERATERVFYWAMREKFGRDFFVNLSANGPFWTYGGTAAASERCASGETPMIIDQMGYQLIPMLAKGAPIAFVYPPEATVIAPGPMLMMKGGANPNCAKLWIDWVLSAKGQKAMTELIGCYSMRIGQPQNPLNPSIEELTVLPLDLDAIVATYDEYLAEWDSLFFP